MKAIRPLSPPRLLSRYLNTCIYASLQDLYAGTSTVATKRVTNKRQNLNGSSSRSVYFSFLSVRRRFHDDRFTGTTTGRGGGAITVTTGWRSGSAERCSSRRLDCRRWRMLMKSSSGTVGADCGPVGSSLRWSSILAPYNRRTSISSVVCCRTQTTILGSIFTKLWQRSCYNYINVILF